MLSYPTSQQCVVCGLAADGTSRPLLCAGCRVEPLSTSESKQAACASLGMDQRWAAKLSARTLQVPDQDPQYAPMRVVAVELETAQRHLLRALVFFEASEMWIELRGHDEESLRFTTHDANPRNPRTLQSDLERIEHDQRRAIAFGFAWAFGVGRPKGSEKDRPTRDDIRGFRRLHLDQSGQEPSVAEIVDTFLNASDVKGSREALTKKVRRRVKAMIKEDGEEWRPRDWPPDKNPSLLMSEVFE